MTSNIELLSKNKELFKVVKLTTGEILMVTMIEQRASNIIFEYPIEVEFVRVPTENGLDHRLSTITYCPFTESRTFIIPNNQVQHINQLSDSMIQPYLRMVTGTKPDVDTTVIQEMNHTIH